MADTTPPCLQQQKPYIIIMSNEQQDNKNTTTSNISSSNKTVSGPPPHDDVNASATTAGFVNLSIGSFDNINAVNTDDLQQLVGGVSLSHGLQESNHFHHYTPSSPVHASKRRDMKCTPGRHSCEIEQGTNVTVSAPPVVEDIKNKKGVAPSTQCRTLQESRKSMQRRGNGFTMECQEPIAHFPHLKNSLMQ